MSTPSKSPALLLHLPPLIYFSTSIELLAVIFCRFGVKYSFNDNEGWNAFWASAAWQGSDLYPGPGSFKLNNYPPLWFYATGALGRLIGDNILAGRILAGSALILNAVAVSLIVRAITGSVRDCLLAGAALLTIFQLFYGTYVAANDPQIVANCLMTYSILILSRPMNDGSLSRRANWFAVSLMLIGGLLKHNVLAVPVSTCIFLILYRRFALAHFIALSAIGIIVVCVGLYLIFGPNLFSSLLFPRQYHLSDAWVIISGQLTKYNLFLLVIPYLAFQTSQQYKLIVVYSTVSFLQGVIFAGGVDIDVNLFFDFAIAIAIGLGLMQNSAFEQLKHGSDKRRSGLLLACWLVISLVPPILSLPEGISDARSAFEALTNNTQRAEVAYIKSVAGHVVCDDLALCYWAGKGFEADLNNLQTLMRAKPAVERDFLARITNCSYALIQLGDEWDDERWGPFTATIIDALKIHYTKSRSTDSALYWIPSNCKVD